MKISLVHPHRLTREVLARTLTLRLGASVVDFSNLEDLLSSSMDYDVFVLYNIFGRTKLDRWEAVPWIRTNKPEALIISMVHHRFFNRRHASPGGDAVLLNVGNETEDLIKVIQKGVKGKSYILLSGMVGDQGD